MKITQTSGPVNTFDLNRKMLYLAKKIINDELSFLETLDPGDWANFISFSQKQGIAPFLYHAIKDSPPESLSEYSLSNLRNIYLDNIHRNIILYDELSKILRKLEEADIPVIVLKGSFLAKTVYENIGLRSMGDIDLLVKIKDITRVVQILGSNGYSAGFDFDIANGLSIQRHLPPLDGPRKIPVEIHWTIFDFSHPDKRKENEIISIWEKAQPLVIEGEPCLMLAPEHLLRHLCVHISKQHLYRMSLRGFLDLKKAIEYYSHSIDWDLIQKQALSSGMDRALKLTLYLADQWVGLDLPDRVRQSLDTQLPDPGIMRWIEDKMFSETPLYTHTKLPEFYAGESILRKIVVLWRQSFLSRAILSRIYKIDQKSLKIYFYYPVRWASLCRRYGPTIWKAWKGDRAIGDPLQQENDLRHWLG